jgi:mRNA interferase RelE/StbE
VELLFKESFARDLKAVKQKRMLPRIREVIDAVRDAPDLQSIPNIRKLNDPGNYYRIRVGDYRLGIKVEKDEVTFVRCLHRRDIYRYFP